ncbi:hypothetical protein CVT24_005357 [Panaeolus cyanescens]|uniref:Uncharacterized protein n=1 Tax=Panaeolus cyanescens TaxID=181874 RepID=A0A409Y9B6_9AGAR|nr:hypothetical protein CVT24_005357 [Panaeolus cyanescens]
MPLGDNCRCANSAHCTRRHNHPHASHSTNAPTTSSRSDSIIDTSYIPETMHKDKPSAQEPHYDIYAGAEPGVNPRSFLARAEYGHFKEKCVIDIIDYDAKDIRYRRMSNDGLLDFLNGKVQNGHDDDSMDNVEGVPGDKQNLPRNTKVRWINIGGIDWEVLSLLAIRYNLHSLALEDILHERGHNQSKADYYQGHVFIRVLCNSTRRRDMVRLDDAVPTSLCLDSESGLYAPSEQDSSRKSELEPRSSRRNLLTHEEIPSKERLDFDQSSGAKRNGKGKILSVFQLRNTMHFPLRKRFGKLSGYTSKARERQLVQLEALKKGDRIEIIEEPVFIFLLRNGTVISIHPTPNLAYTNPISDRLIYLHDSVLRTSEDASLLVQSLLDLETNFTLLSTVVDRALEMVDEYQRKIYDLERQILLGPSMHSVRSLHILSGDLIHHKRSLEPIKTLIYNLRRYDEERAMAVADQGHSVAPPSSRSGSPKRGSDSGGPPELKDKKSWSGDFAGVSAHGGQGGYFSAKAKVYLADVYDHIDFGLSSLGMFEDISENLINFAFNPMPLLGGLFSKKQKSSPRPQQNNDHESNISSPTSSSYHSQYTIAANLVNNNNNLSAVQHSSGHKLRLPFTRKKSNISGSDLTSASTSDLNRQNLFYGHRASSSIDGQPPPPPPPLPDSQDSRRLRPPPSRSAIFAAYGDPNSALSTRSLPNESQLPSSASDPIPVSSSPTPRPPRPQNPNKRPSLFVWSKSNSSSPTVPPKPPTHSIYDSNLSPNSPFDSGTESAADSAPGSFALKSFRNVREPSPANNSNASLSAPIPRPRGESINSESSQRISVAAFREAQARRSMAGSPSPSFRSPSPTPAIPQPPVPTPDPPRARRTQKQTRNSPPTRANQNRRRSLMPASTSESDDDSPDSSDPDSEDDETMRPRISTNHTRFPQYSGKTKAKSEMGHGSKLDTQNTRNDYPVPSRPPRSHTGHSITASSSVQPRPTPITDASSSNQQVQPRSQSSLSNYASSSRQRASASTSALTPSAAAKRASVLATANAPFAKGSLADDKQFSTQQHIKMPEPISGRTNTSMPTTKQTPDSGSDSDDDAPLATLVAPRRPGSAMSSYSTRSTGNISRAGHPPKPLIDINELTNPKRALTAAEKSNEGFTSGQTLLSQHKKESFTGSPLVQSPTAMTPPSQNPPEMDAQPLTRTVPPHKFISPPSSPPKELKQYVSDQSLADTSIATSISSVPVRDSSPEASKRAPLTDRLSRAVKLTASPSVPSPNLNASTASAPEQATRPPETSKSATAPLPPSTSQSRLPGHRRLSSGMKAFSTPAVEKVDPSPPDEDLVQLLGTAGIKFISRTGDSSSESSDTESEPEKQPDTAPNTKDRIAPIPIKQRSPPPAFSVTSRPSFPKRDQASVASFQTATSDTKSTSTSPPTSFTTPRQRSSTLIPSSSSVSVTPKPPGPSASQQNSVPYPARPNFTSNTAGPQSSSPNDRNSSLRPPGTRQRSSTMITGVPLSSQMPKSSTQVLPDKPFASRRDSPASSIGDSSSGRAPLTPRDGSDIAPPSETQSTIKKRNEWNSGVSGLGVKQHIKRRSVSFEDDERDVVRHAPGHLRGNSKARNDSGSGDTSNEDDKEVRRRERRRSEARAAIELGNVINGRGPVVSDDDEDVPLNNQMPVNPMMAQAGQMPGPMGFGAPNQMMWPGNMNMGAPGMLSPAQFMLPPPTTQDPNFLVAHQQAMLIAKQAYQMAVAQQAMAAAADEWERGSAIGGFGGGGSVYGGSTASQSMMVPPFMNMNMGMNMNMNMNMMQANQWSSASSVYMPSSSRSMYGGMMGGISSSRSEYGGGATSATNKWSSSRSTYGENFGPSSASSRRTGEMPRRPLLSGVTASQRDSSYFPNMPPTMPAAQNRNGRGSPDLRVPSNNNPRGRTTSQPAIVNRSPPSHQPRKAPPPSSWKASGV